MRVQYVPAYPEGFDLVFTRLNLQEENETEILMEELKGKTPIYSDQILYYNELNSSLSKKNNKITDKVKI